MKFIFAILLVSLFVFPSLAAVSTQTEIHASLPPVPHTFYGNVTAPNGTLVEARCSGCIFNSDNPVEVYFNHYSDLFVQGNISSGDLITFYIGGVNTGITYPYSHGEVTNIDLFIPVANTTTVPTTSPTPTPTHTYSGGGGGGGSGGGYSYSPATTRVTTVRTTVPTTVPTANATTVVTTIPTTLETIATTIPTTTIVTTIPTTIGNVTSSDITGGYMWVFIVAVGLILIIGAAAWLMRDKKKEEDYV